MWRKYAFQALKYALILILVMFAVDWWRKPEAPAAFARTEQMLQNGGRFVAEEWSRDRVGVVYFWATWCGICRYTSPDIVRLQQSGIPVVGVALQSGNDEEVAGYMRQQGLDFDNINDQNGVLSRDWQVAVTPTVVLLKNGKMVHHTTGISSYWGLRARIAWADWRY
ncbi:MAG: protein disulfide oxidoreductase [Neisseria sp.]|nr:protein disulfide oxidoreductase [Neisseria sp.]